MLDLTYKDGWDACSLFEVIEVLEKAAAIEYEIKNCRRGSYSVNGDTTEDLLNELDDLALELNSIVDNLKEEFFE